MCAAPSGELKQQQQGQLHEEEQIGAIIVGAGGQRASERT